MTRIHPCTAIGLLLVLGGAPSARAWGEKGHRIVNTRALTALPPGLRAWYAGREGRIREGAVEPDQWRAHDRKEGPRHYVNTELYGELAGIPHDADAALAKVGGAVFQKAGTVPWVIQDRYRGLVEAFRQGDADKVAEASAWLGHYVADIHVPLHSTTNHDGQLTDQRGLHSRWESGLVERYADEDAIKPHPAVAEDPQQGPWVWLSESFALVPQVLKEDLEAGRGEDRAQFQRSTGYWRNFWALEGSMVERRLTDASQRLSGLWLAAWIEAGRPLPQSSAVKPKSIRARDTLL
ncbi:MAG TPA: S1/P1 nuclease [Holophagaceae bacterium]|nr:S1/P1 nuclease [Geothrix sp.]HJW32976.1 S1/P1 nuclease [Holophagaceae bacterium]